MSRHRDPDTGLSDEPFVGLKRRDGDVIGVGAALSDEPFVGLKRSLNCRGGRKVSAFRRTLCGVEALNVVRATTCFTGFQTNPLWG